MKPSNFIERKIELIFVWGIKNRYKIFLFLIFSGAVIIFSFLPYFNLFLGKILLSFLILMSFLVSFRINYKKCFLLGLVFLISAIPFIFFAEYETAETLTDFTYGIFFLGLIKFIFSKNA
jgi:hypothetical protein